MARRRRRLKRDGRPGMGVSVTDPSDDEAIKSVWCGIVMFGNVNDHLLIATETICICRPHDAVELESRRIAFPSLLYNALDRIRVHRGDILQSREAH